MHSKMKLPAFCRLCARQAGSERIEKSLQGMDSTDGVEFSLYPSLPTPSPSQAEWSTEESSVIYARSGPLKDAFPRRGGRIRDGNVAQSCTSLCVQLLHQVSRPLNQTDVVRVRGNSVRGSRGAWGSIERGAGKEWGSKEKCTGGKRQVCWAPHARAWSSSVCRIMQRRGGEVGEEIKTKTRARTSTKKVYCLSDKYAGWVCKSMLLWGFLTNRVGCNRPVSCIAGESLQSLKTGSNFIDLSDLSAVFHVHSTVCNILPCV